MAAQFTPIDDAARRDISDSLDETLFVEASAGTGKTTSLVGRVVNLVASGRAALSSIAAITFTEAAAAELRYRIRQELEKAASDVSAYADEERQRCRQGVADLDQAAIQTLHSFASALLHERPLEAGLPPAFQTTDAIEASLKFDAAWDDWIDDALEEDSAVAPHLTMALSLGLTLRQLKDVAKGFHHNYNDLPEAAFEDAPRPQGAAIGKLAGATGELERLCQFSRLGGNDSLYRHVQGKLEAIRGLAGVDPASPHGCRMAQRILPLKHGRGRQGDWDKDPSTGKNACAALKDTLSELEELVSEEIRAFRQAALIPILRALQKFVLDYAAQRRAEGRAEFHDLLVWAVELLRGDIEVRDHFRRRFTHLLIDESQDTDPLQAEIAMFLAEDAPPGAIPAQRPGDWKDITPKRGKLFVVGDPKQSIYRFRRADVAQMDELRQRMGGRKVSLTQNFRSQQPVTDWVNHLFDQWMGQSEDGVQAGYEAMVHRWESATGHSFRPRVWALADEESDGGMDAVREQEASDIARLMRHVVNSPWQVLDQQATGADGIEQYRPATYADICILMPTRTGLRQLEPALEDAGIPYRLENASLIFATQEIRDLMNCFRAIDDPSNQVATVAALRSPAFGCSDADLLRHRESGGSFNYLDTPDGGTLPAQPSTGGVEGANPVGAALAVLGEFHRARVWDSAGSLIDRFIRERLLMEAALGHPRTREQWRRYRFMVEQARQFTEAAEPARSSLRAFLEWLDNQMDENARVTETPVPEEDEEAVRVMTVHAAKGLEFPVVILTGLNSRPGNRTDAALFDRRGGRVEVGLGPKDSRFATAGYESLSEREGLMDAAERVRLMYVAATRARDHLALSLRRSARGGTTTAAGIISEYLRDNPELWEAAPAEPPETAAADGSPDGAAALDHSAEARSQWLERRAELLDSMGRPSFVAATSLGRPLASSEQTSASVDEDKDDKPETDAAEHWRRGRAGTQIGRALHAVLQSADLDTGSDVEVWARAQAVAEGIPDRAREVTQLARRVIETTAVRRAIGSGRYWREVPAAIPVGGGSLQGFIDLLFEENGQLVVVDYKTDAVREEWETLSDRYRMQGAAYALALQQATGKTVKEVIFLFPRPHPALEMPLSNLASLTAEAEALALERLGAAARP